MEELEARILLRASKQGFIKLHLTAEEGVLHT